METNGHGNYERESSRLKLLNAAFQLGLLQQKLAGTSEIDRYAKERAILQSPEDRELPAKEAN